MDKDNILVSVILPNYNHSKYLNERIQSILNQTYTNYEIIILDDCSTDDSRKIIDNYKSLPCVSNIIFNEINSGSPFKQWEKGFSYAKGELIWIAESDDCCEPNFLQENIDTLAKYGNECVISFCRSVKIDTDGNRLSEEGFDNNTYFNGRKFVKRYLSRYNYIPNASSAVFRKDVLRYVDPSYMEFRGCGDWVFWIEVCKNGKVTYINKPLNYFRQHVKSTTSQLFISGGTEQEVIRVYKHMVDRGYIGLKEIFHLKVTRLYSLRYGKKNGFFPKKIEDDYIQYWEGGNIFVKFSVWFIHVLQETGLHVINH